MRRAFVAFLSLALLLALGQSLFDRVTASSQTMGMVRFAHFAVDVAAVDVYVNGELTTIRGLEWSGISAWYSLPPGDYEFAFVLADGPADDLADGALTEPVNLSVVAAQGTTLALIGTQQRDTLTTQLIRENFRELPRGEARLVVFQAIEDWPSVDLIANDNALLQFLNYPGTFETESGGVNEGYVSLDIVANPYEMAFADHADGAPLLDLGGVTLIRNYTHLVASIGTIARPNYTIVLTNLADLDRIAENPLQPARIDEGSGRVRVAHLSSGTPSIDVYINGELSVIRDLRFAEASPFIELPAGTYSLLVTPTGLDPEDAFAAPINVTVERDSWSTAAFIGTLVNDTLELHVLSEDFSPLPPGETRITLFHANPNVGPVVVRLARGAPLVGLLAYPNTLGSNTGYEVIDLIAGTYTLEFARSVSPANVVVNIPDLRLLEGRNTLIAAINATPPYLATFTGIPAPRADDSAVRDDDTDAEIESAAEAETAVQAVADHKRTQGFVCADEWGHAGPTMC